MNTIEVGEVETLQARFLNAAGALTNPTTVTLVYTDPSGNATTIAQAGLTNVSTGVWTYALTVDEAGVWSYRFEGTGAVVAGETGYLLVFAEGATPTGGPCESWVDADDVFDCGPCSSIVAADRNWGLAMQAAEAASRALFIRSERKYPGVCLDTVRPCRQSAFGDPPGGWRRSWGQCGCGASTGQSCGCGGLSEITLGAEPVLAVTQVKVDGTILTRGVDYRVDAHLWLVRLGGDSWPGSQDLSLASTEVGTFEVTYTWGRAAPPDGIIAAKALACELYQACSGGECRLPSRVRAVVRQGVEMLFHDPIELAKSGLFGIPEIDNFLQTEQYASTHRDTVVATPSTSPAVRHVNT